MFVHADDEGVGLRVDESAIGLGRVDQHDLLVSEFVGQAGQVLGRPFVPIHPRQSRDDGSNGAQVGDVLIERQLSVDF